MEFKVNKTYCLDCLTGLKKIPNKSIDLTYFDPIYNAKKDYGVYKDNLPEDEYIFFMQNVIQECKRISKRGIGIYVDSWRFELFYKVLFPESKFIIIWKKSPSFKNKQNILPCNHFILTNAIAVKNVKSLWPDIHPPSDGFYFKMDKTEKKFNHPAQTSLKATKRFIEYFSLEGELILDCFMGIGTTAIACTDLGRNFLGFEINPDYITIQNNEIKNKKKKPKSNLNDFLG